MNERELKEYLGVPVPNDHEFSLLCGVPMTSSTDESLSIRMLAGDTILIRPNIEVALRQDIALFRTEEESKSFDSDELEQQCLGMKIGHHVMLGALMYIRMVRAGYSDHGEFMRIFRRDESIPLQRNGQLNRVQRFRAGKIALFDNYGREDSVPNSMFVAEYDTEQYLNHAPLMQIYISDKIAITEREAAIDPTLFINGFNGGIATIVGICIQSYEQTQIRGWERMYNSKLTAE